jgi:hypothetical protein
VPTKLPLPDSLVIYGGVYSGLSLPSAAILPSDEGTPTLLRSPLTLWRRYPVPVVLTGGSGGPDDEDHADRLRRAIRKVNGLAGFEVLRIESGPSGKGVRVSFTPPSRGALGATAIDTAPCGFSSEHGFLCAPSWIDRAVVHLAPDAEVAVIQHELLHSLGLGHTCVVESVMVGYFSNEELEACAGLRTELGLTDPLFLERSMSPFDIAAVQLLRSLAQALDGRQTESIPWPGAVP